MLRRLLLSALIAGLLGGLVATIAQAALVWPLIEKAEALEAARASAAQPGAQGQPRASDHAHAARPSVPSWFTAGLANIVVGVGFALLLAGGLLLARSAGGMARGAAWGCGGFLAFVAAPALVLPVLPPGVEAGDLGTRQLIWVATALATASGLMLATLARRPWLRGCGVAMIAAPHALVGVAFAGIGALPPMDGETAALRGRYLHALFLAAGLFWLTLGASGGAIWARLARS